MKLKLWSRLGPVSNYFFNFLSTNMNGIEEEFYQSDHDYENIHMETTIERVYENGDENRDDENRDENLYEIVPGAPKR